MRKSLLEASLILIHSVELIWTVSRSSSKKKMRENNTTLKGIMWLNYLKKPLRDLYRKDIAELKWTKTKKSSRTRLLNCKSTSTIWKSSIVR